MSKEMGIEGVGPKIIGAGIVYALIVYFISRNNLETFRFADDLSRINWLIYALAIIGVVLWLGSAIQLLIGFRNDRLVTRNYRVLSSFVI